MIDNELLFNNAICKYRALFGEYKQIYKKMLGCLFISDDGELYQTSQYGYYSNKVKHLEYELKMIKMQIEKIKEKLHDSY